jgi:outer membrane protein
MRNLFLVIISVLTFNAGSALAQTATPTPMPVATPAPTVAPVVTPTPIATPQVQASPENVPVPAVAPTFESKIGTLPEVTRVGVDMQNQLPLTLAQALELALSNNKDIEVTRENVRISQFDLAAARGIYEPRFTGQTYYEHATVPNVSFFTPTITKVTNNSIVGNAGLVAYVPQFGTTFNASLNNTNLQSSNPINIISPQLSSNLVFTLTQPLFRNRSFDQNRRTIEIAKRNVDISNTQFRQRSIDSVNAVQRAYWDLTYALRNLQVQRDAARDARAQLEHNRRLVEEGQLAPIDVVATETQVANFEQAVYDALNTVNQAENVLKNLISPNRNDAIWGQAITPVDSVELTVPPTTLTDAIDAAMQNRPELEINTEQKALNAVDQRFYKNQKEPQIDLVASYTSAGIGGSLNPNFTNPLAGACNVPTPTPQARLPRSRSTSA